MGVLRKLAELVVEFPDDAQASAAGGKGNAGGGDTDDVLAQIERARADLDNAVQGKGDPADPLSGGKFKPKPGAAPSASPSPSPAAGVPAGPVSAGIALPSQLTVPQIYAHAGLEPKEGVLDIFRIEQMLSDPEMADLDLSIRARTVKQTLKTMGKELHEILLDAGRRDQALDAYGQWLVDAVQKVEAQVEGANARLKQEIDAFIAQKNAEIEANRSLLEDARRAQQRFADDKAREEQRLFEIAAPFVAPGENPVVMGARPGPPKGETQ